MLKSRCAANSRRAVNTAQRVESPHPFKKEFRIAKYPVKVTRTVTYLEELELTVIADDEDEASLRASNFASTGIPDWPTIDRYNVVHKQPISYGTVVAVPYV